MTFSLQGRYHAWVAALRIARRDAWRAKGRSSLVLAMIALPIIGVSAADLTLRSAELSPEQTLSRQLGTADAQVHYSRMNMPIYQLPNGSNYAPVGGFEKVDGAAMSQEPPEELDTSVLPAGTQVIKDSVGYGKVRTKHGLLGTDLRELDTQSPLVDGIFTLDRGRIARARRLRSSPPPPS